MLLQLSAACYALRCVIEFVTACHTNDTGRRGRWHGSNQGPWGHPEAPIEKVVVFHCNTCARITNNKGGNLPLCEKCAERCCSKMECPVGHMMGGKNERGRHLPYITLEKCINLA